MTVTGSFLKATESLFNGFWDVVSRLLECFLSTFLLCVCAGVKQLPCHVAAQGRGLESYSRADIKEECKGLREKCRERERERERELETPKEKDRYCALLVNGHG